MRKKSRNTFVVEDVGARKVLRSLIVGNLSSARLAEALGLRKSERCDAVESVIKEAVRLSPVVSFSGIPHVYDKGQGIYVPFDFHEMELAIYDAMRDKKVPNGYYGNISKITKLCWAESQSRKSSTDKTAIVLGNGVYDTLDNTLHEYSERFLVDTKVDYDYNPNDMPLLWRRFLQQVLPDAEMQLLLQEFVAAAFIDRKFVKFEYMLILLGSGSNGKSVVFEVITALLGEGGISNFSIRDLISSGRSEQNVAMCNGKRMNYCSEIRTTEIGEKNADAFKSLVSGEAQMARSLYKEPFRATDIPVIMANANKLPRLSDASYALQRRILVIPFETFIPDEEQDKELAETLKGELPGIFNWMLEGLRRLQNNGYTLDIPMKVRKIVADYIKSNNAVSLWLEDRRMFSCWHAQTNPSPEWRKTKSLYDDFTAWCKDNGYEQKQQRELSDELKVLGFQEKRHSSGIGFLIYISPSQEEIRAANMDIAIGLQSQQYIEMLKAAAVSMQKVEVEGVEDLERYLGLPKDCIWPYIQSGQLDGAFYTNAGRMMFDVRKIQVKLADAGFYKELVSDTNSCKRRATSVLKGMRQTFNAKMRAMGQPFRKYGNVSGYIPVADKDCIVGPDDWEFSKRAAELLLRKRMETTNQ